ncbi:MAG TPA: hypothetical protein VFR81_04790 [Longimicrobium sp.]|nr:hypothetical protein [Longimicrobium sp.]
MKMQRIVPLMTAALVAGACTGETASPTAVDGTLAAPAGPRMEGSQMGGSGGFTGGGEEPLYNPTAGSTTPTDSTALTGRGSQMGGSGG